MNDIALTNDNLIPKSTENQIIKLEKKIAELKKAQDEMRAKLFDEMQKRNIRKIETDKLTITLIDETTRESFDTKKFREENRDLYDEYVKLSTVKASIRIGVK